MRTQTAFQKKESRWRKTGLPPRCFKRLSRRGVQRSQWFSLGTCNPTVWLGCNESSCSWTCEQGLRRRGDEWNMAAVYFLNAMLWATVETTASPSSPSIEGQARSALAVKCTNLRIDWLIACKKSDGGHSTKLELVRVLLKEWCKNDMWLVMPSEGRQKICQSEREAQTLTLTHWENSLYITGHNSAESSTTQH